LAENDASSQASEKRSGDAGAVKKNFPVLVEAAVSTQEAGDERPVLILAQDEGCFGRISEVKRAWAPPGMRPSVPVQVVREYVYVYAAVAPAQGQMISLILPETSTAMMNLFLEQVSQTFPRLAELTLLTALRHGTLITSDSTYYQQVQEAVGHDSAWTHYHRIAIGLEAGPAGIALLRASGIAVLYLYCETLVFVRPVMQTEHLEIAEQVLRVVRSAAEQLLFAEEELRWLKNWM
jgi:hypothetical protein